MQVNPWLVLALAGGLLATDQVRTGETTREATLEVVTKRTLMSAPAAPTVGLGFVTGGELRQADGVTRIGEGYSHCAAIAVSTAAPPEVTAHCTSVFRLPDGELHLSGLRKYKSIAAGFEDTSVAVTGGTGVYANARGEGKVTRSGSPDVGYKFVFTADGPGARSPAQAGSMSHS
ncbi:allene oxide cyclase barrel-like domain-containing protein [Saccharothrix luteola]|uniref:allene oxide cyclase barrel-like domain-containing protein n=1 Tax=Saccharothrix luteola TaxID=2893018 RepID=UPI001E558203|nr:hypothetical protein [Saccharothrix luteola]MCC8246180.1 hypothetical protein [Saccharothrix luteola]